MSTPGAPDEPRQRHCGYTPCGRPLPYDGRGRPPEYCSDRRWPDGRTCKQMAAAERAGERAVGLDAPLEAFRGAADRFLPTAGDLAQRLTELLDTVGAVRDGALAAIGEAERSAATATTTAQLADRDRDRAIAERDRAIADRDRARLAAQDADTRADQARAEADTRVQAAWAKATDADHARGVADEATRVARRQALAADEATGQARREAVSWEAATQDARRASDEATRRTEQVTAALTRAETTIASLRQQVTRLENDLERAIADADTARSALAAVTAVTAVERARESATWRRGETRRHASRAPLRRQGRGRQ